MDYFGRWKALMYYTKRFYAPTLVSIHAENENMNFYVVSDSPETLEAKLRISLIDLNGKQISQSEHEIAIEPLKGRSYLSIPAGELLNGADTGNVVLIADLNVGGRTVSKNQYYFKPFKEMSFSKPVIETRVEPSAKGFSVRLSSDRVARAVQLAGVAGGSFDDNYFDLIPGKTVEVEFRSDKKMSAEDFRRSLNVRSLVDAF
jgi:beta-mannosidase